MQTNLDGVFSMAVEPGTMLSAGDTQAAVFRNLPSKILKSIKETRQANHRTIFNLPYKYVGHVHSQFSY